MRVLSVNVSEPKEIEHRGTTTVTGIFKEPVEGRVMLRELNLDGDGQADLINHGGIYKAAYFYPYEHYATWAQELERDDFVYGQFGENFTTEGLIETEVYIGDVYRVGQALVQVTQPRMPCFKLGIRMDMPLIVKKFLHASRSGFYVRVLEEGTVAADDPIEKVLTDPNKVSVQDIYYAISFDKTNKELAERALKVESLSPGWRGSFEEILSS